MTEDLLRFYDFASKTVLYVGAGGRQLLPATAGAGKLIAIDQNMESLRELRAEVSAKGLHNSIEIVGSKFEDVQLSGDVVYFEFCLHEMSDPYETLIHAKNLAADIVVYDHSPRSEWISYGAEEDKVEISAEAMRRFGVRRTEKFCTEQRFANYGELVDKVRGQGPIAVHRTERFAAATEIVIPMMYELCLL